MSSGFSSHSDCPSSRMRSSPTTPSAKTRGACALWLKARTALAFSMSGLSKIAGLPQMKLGWIVIAGPAAARAEARDKLEWIADTYLSVSTPVQQAAPASARIRQGHSVADRGPRARESGVAPIRDRRRHRLAACWRSKAAGTPHCKCRASAARKNGRSSCWRGRRAGAAGFLFRFRIRSVPGGQPADRSRRRSTKGCRRLLARTLTF